jgi:hypothetical protein
MEIDPTKVVVPSDKLTGYLLSTTHPIGRYKSAFFLGLGYTPDAYERLEEDLKALLAASAEIGEVTAFGQKIQSRGQIAGPNGRAGRVLAIWIILSGESLVRFVTAYPEG